MTGQPPSGSIAEAGVKMAKTMSVFVAAEACLMRRSVPPLTFTEESSVAIALVFLVHSSDGYDAASAEHTVATARIFFSDGFSLT